jgi:hypothetical protein
MPGDGKDAIGLDREMKPVSSGCADVNGIKLYHEIYGQGEPLVLIQSSDTFGLMARAIKSGPPPAPNGSIMRTGFDG